MFSCEFGEISKITSFTEHLWTTASKPIKPTQTNLYNLHFLISKQQNNKVTITTIIIIIITIIIIIVI